MINNENKLISMLFETNAVRVCPENKPFWYTSGTIGPYYINTHFLYGSEERANHLLETIEEVKSDKETCPINLMKVIDNNYTSSSIFFNLINIMVEYIKNNIPLEQIDIISGGERRDWFFSLIISKLLNKPHLTIFKDLDAVLSYNGEVQKFIDLKGKKLLHIADLITEASSYERAWVPAVEKHGGEILWSLVVVDRKQGGDKVLGKLGVEHHALVGIDKSLFDTALEMGRITPDQYKMILDFTRDPIGSMSSFLQKHPEFMENALKSDEKTVQRARLCLEKNVYGIKI